MTVQEANERLFLALKDIYEEREAAVITGMVMEDISGWKKADRVLNKNADLPDHALGTLKKYTMELLHHRPVQYVLHESWFQGMKFYVDERVLIPRPETEELVQWVIDDIKKDQSAAIPIQHTLLDVGTGSGCISIALKKKLPELVVFACDISGNALEVARRNARALETAVNFLQLDFLDAAIRHELPVVDYIVSNPPYIPVQEKDKLDEHIVGYEPHLALFTPDSDSLIFYEAIADFAAKSMLSGTKIFTELHESKADDVRELFYSRGFTKLETKKDLQGKNRLIKATVLL